MNKLEIALNTFRLAVLLPVLCALPCQAQAPHDPSPNVDLPDPIPNQDSHSSSVSKTEFLNTEHANIRVACMHKFDQVVELAGRSVLCLDGRITNETNTIDARNRHFSVAYVNSGGGEISTALKIGREIHKNSAYLMVDKNCYSSCANYLIPAARRLYITDRTVIAMHGSLPRDAIYHAKISNKKATDRAIASGSMTIIREQFDENKRRFRKYVQDHLLDEFWYFIDIGRNEGYARRFDFVRRRLRAVDDARCAEKKGLYLIVGPKHLKAFKIKTIRSWFPEDRADYLDIMPSPKEDHALIFDYDSFPFWAPDRGLTSYTSCMKEDTQSLASDRDN